MVGNGFGWTRLVVATAMIAGMAAATGCSITNGPNEIRLNATALTAPATIAANAPLTADVVVTRGACESFDRFDVMRSGSQIVLTPIGRDERPAGGACTLQLILEHRTYTGMPPYGSSITISVRRVDGSLLSQQVAVQ